MSDKVQHITQADFERLVLKSQTPTVVDFYADWCGPCRMVSPVIESLSQEYSGKVSFAKVDTDANQSLAMRYEIMSIPTVMIFKGGRLVDKIIGAMPADAYRRKIDAALGGN
ncbi:MAG: thioredoxin [Nitrososphaerota archaeon]|jgi:thioredoxin 1|nr:thioredoxin [Nitrososphaerota archaeon]MDG6980593.1 thioredoxin [Nitrososphaerota archaeon]MDG6983673.1 thioredoxin [Nitrososphaerota archaeon]